MKTNPIVLTRKLTKKRPRVLVLDIAENPLRRKQNFRRMLQSEF